MLNPRERQHEQFVTNGLSNINERLEHIQHELRDIVAADKGSSQTISSLIEATKEQVQDVVRGFEERFRSLGENLPLIVSLARPDGTIEYINSWWTTFSGRSSEDFINGDWLNAVHPDDTGHMLSGWQTALASSEPYSYEFRALSKDGSYRWLFARGVPLRDANGTITQWINTALDIHNRKEAEDKVRESEKNTVPYSIRLTTAFAY
jgi:PAS domain S-box-containing protein